MILKSSFRETMVQGGRELCVTVINRFEAPDFILNIIR